MLAYSEPLQVVSHIPITSDFLLHIQPHTFLDQYWLQVVLVYVTMSGSIVRNIGQFANLVWKESREIMIYTEEVKRKLETILKTFESYIDS